MYLTFCMCDFCKTEFRSDQAEYHTLGFVETCTGERKQICASCIGYLSTMHMNLHS